MQPLALSDPVLLVTQPLRLTIFYPRLPVFDTKIIFKFQVYNFEKSPMFEHEVLTTSGIAQGTSCEKSITILPSFSSEDEHHPSFRRRCINAHVYSMH